MKKLALMIIVVHMFFCAFAQNTPNPVASAALDKFVGTWVYNKDGREVKIVLKKVTIRVNKENYYIDVIEGYHIYKVNNKSVENYQEKNKSSLTLGNIEIREKPDKLKITIIDSIKNKSGTAFITFMPGTPDKIRWSLNNNREGIIVHRPGEPEFDKTFTLPESMILEREK